MRKRCQDHVLTLLAQTVGRGGAEQAMVVAREGKTVRFSACSFGVNKLRIIR